MKRYTIWRYQDAGFGHGWKSEEADTIPEGAVSVSTFEPVSADRTKAFAVDNQTAQIEPAEVTK